MSFNNKINQIEGLIEELIKREIKNKGLVKTGKLLNSITVNIKQTSSGLSVEVEGEDYFEFLDDEHDITRDAFNSTTFSSIQEKLEEAYVELIKDKIEKL